MRNAVLMRKGNRAFLLLAIALVRKWQIASLPKDIHQKNKLGDRMTQQLWNSVIAKYRDLSVSRTSIICRSRLLATDKSGYFAQPRPVIVNYFNRFYCVLILPGEILCWPTLLLELKRVNTDTVGSCYRLKSNRRMF